MGEKVKVHLKKARESAILAVEVYNKPAVEFRSGGFIVLMNIAWTALFHAIFFRNKIKPYYRDRKNPRYYQKVDRDYKAWELSECIRQYFGGINTPERKNLEFFVKLRNKIEHRSMPVLDAYIFGECQAHLFNFEDMLYREFGDKYALNESLSLALQFAHIRNEEQERAIRRLYKPLARDIEEYISTFRSSLSHEELHDLKYSYKMFLIPKLANHPGQADVAVEFVKFDPNDPEKMNEYAKLTAIIKQGSVAVANPGKLKPGEICLAVQPIVETYVGAEKKFSASYHHVKACRFYKVRPVKGDDPRKTNTKFCQYDEAHKDYIYTEEWKRFLMKEMAKPGQYDRILGVTATS